MKTKRISVDITVGVARRFKTICSKYGKTQREVILRLIDKFLKEKEGK